MINRTNIANLALKTSLGLLILPAAIAFFAVAPVAAQPPTVVKVVPKPAPKPAKVIVNDGDTPAEKAIVTEAKVVVNLCIREGSVRINGWDREEIRAYIENGSEVGFRVQQWSKAKKPVWLSVVGFDPQKNKLAKPEECLSGTDIEIDVPRGAAINISRSESDVRIDSVAKVAVELLSGDIVLNDIPGGIDAVTFLGDITVENASGKISLLNNGDGNILVSGAQASEIGDIFRAKTSSGRITLRGVEHQQIETSSITGATTFDGELAEGGQYKFSTENGSLALTLPVATLCAFNALFGFGEVMTEIPLQKTIKKDKSLTAQFGTAETNCSVRVTTGSGLIRIRKRP